jgi:hypothetical protein
MMATVGAKIFVATRHENRLLVTNRNFQQVSAIVDVERGR